MTAVNFEAAVLFATQTAEGTYNSGLDALTTTLNRTDGLLLGSSGEGVKDSGLTFGTGRVFEQRGITGSGFTRALSNFLRANVPTFTFVCPFVGSREDASSPPVDADMDLSTTLPGLDALLEGMGMEGNAIASATVGHEYKFGSPAPISALVYASGNRLELLDCRVDASIDFTPGAVPKLTATISVGSIKDASTYTIGSLSTTYGAQQSVAAPIVEDAIYTWSVARSFESGTLSFGTTIEDKQRSNAVDGVSKKITNREVRWTSRVLMDSAAAAQEYGQLTETDSANLDAMSWEVGDAATATNPVEQVQISIPQPELESFDFTEDGNDAVADIVARASHATANEELTISFF